MLLLFLTSLKKGKNILGKKIFRNSATTDIANISEKKGKLVIFQNRDQWV